MDENISLEWFVIPPYGNEGWRIFNKAGEYVASFEIEGEAKETVKLHNEKYLKDKK